MRTAESYKNFYDNGKTASITYGQVDFCKIYEYGHEALNIKDFYTDRQTLLLLIEKAETLVRTSFPSDKALVFDWENDAKILINRKTEIWNHINCKR